MSGRLHRRCVPQGEGKGPGMWVCPVNWRGKEVAAGEEPVWKFQLVQAGEIDHLFQERKCICKTRKGLTGNQRMNQDWHWAVSRLFCREREQNSEHVKRLMGEHIQTRNPLASWVVLGKTIMK